MGKLECVFPLVEKLVFACSIFYMMTITWVLRARCNITIMTLFHVTIRTLYSLIFYVGLSVLVPPLGPNSYRHGSSIYS